MPYNGTGCNCAGLLKGLGSPISVLTKTSEGSLKESTVLLQRGIQNIAGIQTATKGSWVKVNPHPGVSLRLIACKSPKPHTSSCCLRGHGHFLAQGVGFMDSPGLLVVEACGLYGSGLEAPSIKVHTSLKLGFITIKVPITVPKSTETSMKGSPSRTLGAGREG